MYILKFVLRSWWRNKLFVTISLVSLVIGIACTNLLTTFVLYEYNIEYNNPNRDRILRLTQTLPFAQQEMQGTFVYHESVPEIISQFPEIEASLRTQAITHTKIRVGDQEYSELNLLSADSTLPKFIPIETLAGKIEEVLTHPGTIAISQALAERYFGTTDCLGKLLDIPQSGESTYRIAAVFRLPPQSMLQADLLTHLKSPEGTTCSILLKEGTDLNAFRQRFETTELPTLLGKGYYRTQTLQESYFTTTTQDSNQCIEHRQKALLSVGLLSALLILFIGCFNYINLSFSRLLKQIRTLHIESLLGASHRQIPLATLCRYFPDGDYSVLVIHSVDERPVSSIQCNNIRTSVVLLSFLRSGIPCYPAVCHHSIRCSGRIHEPEDTDLVRKPLPQLLYRS